MNLAAFWMLARVKHKTCFSLVPINFFYGRELIIKSSADFWGDEWVKGGRKEVAEKDEEAKIEKKIKMSSSSPAQEFGNAPVSASGSARYLT